MKSRQRSPDQQSAKTPQVASHDVQEAEETTAPGRQELGAAQEGGTPAPETVDGVAQSWGMSAAAQLAGLTPEADGAGEQGAGGPEVGGDQPADEAGGEAGAAAVGGFALQGAASGPGVQEPEGSGLAQELERAAGNLDPDLRKNAEQAFGEDFADVNVHVGDGAAAAVGARAVTYGEDIHFASGQYEPGTLAGQERVNEELAHVVQQRRGTSAVDQGGAFDEGAVDQGLEGEAKSAGRRAASGGSAPISGVSRSRQGQRDAFETPEPPATIQSYLDAGNAAGEAYGAAQAALTEYNALAEEVWDTEKFVKQYRYLQQTYDPQSEHVEEGAEEELAGLLTGAKAAMSRLPGLVASAEAMVEWYELYYSSTDEEEKQEALDQWEGEVLAEKGLFEQMEESLENRTAGLAEAKSDLYGETKALLQALGDAARASSDRVREGLGQESLENNPELDSELQELDDTAANAEYWGVTRDAGSYTVHGEDGPQTTRIHSKHVSGDNLENWVDKVEGEYDDVYEADWVASGVSLADEWIDTISEEIDKVESRDFEVSSGTSASSAVVDAFLDKCRDYAWDMSDLAKTGRKSPATAGGEDFYKRVEALGGLYRKYYDASFARIWNRVAAYYAVVRILEACEGVRDDLQAEWSEAASVTDLQGMVVADLLETRWLDRLVTRFEKYKQEMETETESRSHGIMYNEIIAKEQSYTTTDLDAQRLTYAADWFNYESVVESNALKAGIENPAAIAELANQKKMAAALARYSDWMGLIDAAYDAVGDDPHAIAAIREFEQQVVTEFLANIGIPQEDAIQEMEGYLNQLSTGVDYLADSGYSGKDDAWDLARKTMFKGLAGADTLTSGDADSVFGKIGKVTGALGKAKKGIDVMKSAAQFMKAGDAMQLTDTKHPTVQGLAGLLGMAKEFLPAKLGPLGALFGFYVQALDQISTGLAKISKLMARKRLELIAITGEYTSSQPILR